MTKPKNQEESNDIIRQNFGDEQFEEIQKLHEMVGLAILKTFKSQAEQLCKTYPKLHPLLIKNMMMKVCFDIGLQGLCRETGMDHDQIISHQIAVQNFVQGQFKAFRESVEGENDSN